MHTPTMILSSIFFLAASATAHMIPPQPPHPHILPRSATPAASSLQEKCTFTLWHKQLSGSSPTKNYVYLPKLIDHTNNLVIDITAAKPAQEHNSYTRVSETQKYSIAGLLDDDALTISAHDGSDVLVFETQRLRWEAGAEKVVTEGAEAWCQVQEWVESGLANRERKVECAFPCAKMNEEDPMEEERQELK